MSISSDFLFRLASRLEPQNAAHTFKRKQYTCVSVKNYTQQSVVFRRVTLIPWPKKIDYRLA